MSFTRKAGDGNRGRKSSTSPGISAYKLAQEIHVPVSRIQDILHDRRKITADTALRLAKYFGVSDGYFLRLQNDIDLRNMKELIGEEIETIHVYEYV